MNAKKLLPKSLLDEKSWQIAVTVHKLQELQELQELQKNDMPVLGLAGCHRWEMKNWCRYADWRPNLYHQIKWVSSLVAVPSDLSLPPAVKPSRSFTSLQMFHTHTLPREGGKLRSGRWNENEKERKWRWGEDENEMKITWPGREEGNAKEEGTRKHQHNENWPKAGKPWKGKGKRKAEADWHGTRPAEGGKDGSAWTNLTQRKPTPTLARKGPNLPVEEKTTHEVEDPWGGLWGTS